MLSVLIGGIALLIQFLVDFERRQTSVERQLAEVGRGHAGLAGELERIVSGEIAKINDATALADRIDRSVLSPGSIRKLTALSAELAGRPLTLPYKVAQAEIDSAVHFLEQVTHAAEISYDGEDRDWLLALTQSSVASIDATSKVSGTPDGTGFTDEGFWDSELGIRYLEWQREALRRGVAVRRMFVLENLGLLRVPGFRQLCEHQRSLGIVVRLLDASALDPGRRMLVPALVIFDREVSYELTAGARFGDARAPYFIKTRLLVDPRVVRERVRLFEDFYALSVDYEPPA
jgi:hypothetical protein